MIYKSYSNKYQKDVACSYGYELVCVDNKFSKPFKSYLREDAVYNFIDSMIEESKYFSEVMKKPFNKELVMTKKHNEDFKNPFKYWFCGKNVDVDVKIKDHCHITGQYRGSKIKILISMVLSKSWANSVLNKCHTNWIGNI